MKKIKIHQFENGIYQPCVFIVADNRLDLIKENFTEIDGGEIDLSEVDCFTQAFVYQVPVIHKDNANISGMLIVFQSKQNMQVEIMAHEAYHAMLLYAEHIGLNYERGGSNEARAYLLEWMVKCCNQVKKIKDKKK